jgi:hypothetical protein
VTGGHWLDTDTGPGPVLLDAPEHAEQPTPAEPAERPDEKAWREHSAHRDRCTQCKVAVWRCATGDELLNAFLTARGLPPLPTTPRDNT